MCSAPWKARPGAAGVACGFGFGETVRVPFPDGRAAAGMSKTIPALPVRDVGAAVAHYRDRFGFEAPYVADDFAILARDEAVLHLWGAADEQWRSREDLSARPVSSGAESFLAGTASCRIEVADVEALFRELAPRGVLHDGSQGGVESTDYGTREFAAVDLDGNLLIFFHRGRG
jgi:uncharacterized glyoxalase superfamily protein PhnB